MTFSRRKFFAVAGTTAVGTLMVSPMEGLLSRQAFGRKLGKGYGPLVPDPNGLLDLPGGFKYRTFSLTGELMNDGTKVPGGHDGMAAFPGPRNTVILVRNHELSPTSETQVQGPNPYDPFCKGGTTNLVVGSNRQLIKHFTSLSGTYRNCAGGLTPWGSWISCEENTSTPTSFPLGDRNYVSKFHGYNFEVPASTTTAVKPEPLIAMGRFNHEAVAVDPKTGIVYETEDRGDSLFYRFIPKERGKLEKGGTLQALKFKDIFQAQTFADFPKRKPMKVEWVTITEPNPPEDTVRVEGFAKGAAQFARGEGIWYGDGEFYFCCTSGGALGLGQVWRYIPAKETIELFVESTSAAELENPDNIVVSPYGDLILCEDGDDQQFLVGVTPKGELYQFARNAINDSEFAGACFSPDGKTLFVNIQTPGITFAIWGPWTSHRG
ncbi:PhoX family protein [Nostoc sphaeroides CHAB 2801]|uniref:alkaline phosphatase PhoX n=1 Tax=Nostoc sphaeroides TaxID=446679 RepID=UPI000E554CC3|nr:alkaline phosphatase PhoX [Nostoc sphaeroides]MCC5628900.1 PhoX family protein [Nostoc sphaeroides CHAB 2801]